MLVRRSDQVERPLPADIRVLDLFDTMDRALLILGAPGSGKTTLLLELARDLLDRADRDPAQPDPGRFSNVDLGRKAQGRWSNGSRTNSTSATMSPGRSRTNGSTWTGFSRCWTDSMRLRRSSGPHASRPSTCSGSRTAFFPWQSRVALPTTMALAPRLRLYGAVAVQPITHEQVGAYLTDLGPAGEPVRSALRADTSLWELLDSPLLVNIVAESCAGDSGGLFPIRGSVAERRDQLLGSYVKQMIGRRAAERRYTLEQTVRWLTWLAQQIGRSRRRACSISSISNSGGSRNGNERWFGSLTRWSSV